MHTRRNFAEALKQLQQYLLFCSIVYLWTVELCVYSDSRPAGGGGGGRYEPYPPGRREGYVEFRGGAGPAYDHREPPVQAAPREDFASDQVKDLLELYFRDPYAFDQYAKTYYYGERAERARAYYDRRLPEA